jgi:hypothetical protein
VADFAAHRSVAVVIAVFVPSDRDDRDVVDYRVPQMAQSRITFLRIVIPLHVFV